MSSWQDAAWPRLLPFEPVVLVYSQKVLTRRVQQDSVGRAATPSVYAHMNNSIAEHLLIIGAGAPADLTAITDNAALTYLGSLISGMSEQAKYMLVAGAVAGGGLTVIANAPYRAGEALLRDGFNDESIGVGGLLLGSLAPTAVAMLALFLL